MHLVSLSEQRMFFNSLHITVDTILKQQKIQKIISSKCSPTSAKVAQLCLLRENSMLLDMRNWKDIVWTTAYAHACREKDRYGRIGGEH